MSQLILQPFCRLTYLTAHSQTFLSLYLPHSSFSNPSVALPTSHLNLQAFRCFSYVTAHYPTCLRFTYVTAYSHYPTLPWLHLRHSSFSNPSVASPTSQVILIIQPFRRFSYVTAHSSTIPSLHLRHSSFSNPSVATPKSQLILKSFRRITYATAHSHPTLATLHLRHSSFSNPSVASPTSQLILQTFRRFINVTAHSPTLPSLHVRHSSFSNPCVASPTSPGEPPMICVLKLNKRLISQKLMGQLNWNFVYQNLACTVLKL